MALLVEAWQRVGVPLWWSLLMPEEINPDPMRNWLPGLGSRAGGAAGRSCS